jgi:hypothetical protein
VQTLALKVIQAARDPVAVASAIGAMRVANAGDTGKQAMTQALLRLMQYDDAALRTRSLQALPLWDQDKARVSQVVAASVGDAAPQTRQAGLMLILSGEVEPQSVKPALFAALTSPSQDLRTRAMAWQALQNVPLSADERKTRDAAYTTISKAYEEANRRSPTSGQ